MFFVLYSKTKNFYLIKIMSSPSFFYTTIMTVLFPNLVPNFSPLISTSIPKRPINHGLQTPENKNYHYDDFKTFFPKFKFFDLTLRQ